jgi:hypothetical protein
MTDNNMPTIQIQIEQYLLKGTTTLYGRLRRVGGDHPPRALLDLVTGESISCRVTNSRLAKQLAQRLYERIGVRGVAQWDARDMSLYEFRIESLLDYHQVDLVQAVVTLQDTLGHYYENIDLEGAFADLRGYGDDECVLSVSTHKLFDWS